MSEAVATDDHEAIRDWVETRKGRPARVKVVSSGSLLRIDFGEHAENLEPISWETFFEIFDHNKLRFLHQEKTADAKTKRFNKFLDRDG